MRNQRRTRIKSNKWLEKKKKRSLKNWEGWETQTFVLDGLSLRGRGASGNSATDEDDEFLNAGPLEVSEMADIRSIGQIYRVGSIRVALQNQQRGDLHLFLSLSLSLSKTMDFLSVTSLSLSLCLSLSSWLTKIQPTIIRRHFRSVWVGKGSVESKFDSWSVSDSMRASLSQLFAIRLAGLKWLACRHLSFTLFSKTNSYFLNTEILDY